MSVSKYPELAAFFEQHALKRGTFKLASGRTSSLYVDGKLLSYDPQGISLVADAMLDEIKDCDFDALGGMELGATGIAPAVVLRGKQRGFGFHGFTIRKAAKAHGTKKQIEGPLTRGERVVVVDDVVTSGKSILEAVDAVKAFGCEVVLAVSIVDRSEGGEELLAQRGVEYRPLMTLADLGVSVESTASSG